MVHGKDGKYRLVPFGDRMVRAGGRVRQPAAALRPVKKSALFLTQGRPLRDGRSIWVIVNRYAQRALGLSCGFTRLESTRSRGRGRATPLPSPAAHGRRYRAAPQRLQFNGAGLRAGARKRRDDAVLLGTDLGQLREAAA
ncbi:hypothetical protein GCM10027191_11410 [Novilysobacter erysipheiresistens]